MRICSLLPSATEILFALGLGDNVAGVTHECDFPPQAKQKQVVVRSRLPHNLEPAEIDRHVSEFLTRGESLYSVDLEALRAIGPDLVITQDLCHVCAASAGDLAVALAGLPQQPRALSLTPHNLAEVWNSIRAVGEATGRAAKARALVAELERRVVAVEQAVSGAAECPRVVCMEWLDPPYAAGHWVPEMVARAGGREALGRAGEPSSRVHWEGILSLQPEVILVMPCGYHLEQVVEEFARTELPAGWENLSAVRKGRVYAVDASSYFSRPGPRLATGVEILAHVLHPQHAPVAPPAGSFCPVFANVP
jgi:iron complex transport system substrate-binding protein